MDSKQALDYRFLARWFFSTGAYRYRKKLLLLIFLTIMAALSEGISLWLIVPIFRAVIPAEGPDISDEPVLGSITGALHSQVGPDAFLITMLFLVVLLVAAKTSLTLLVNWQTARCQWSLTSDWAKKLLDVYLHKDYLSFMKDDHGIMLGNITIETRIAAFGIRDAIVVVSQLILSIAYICVLFVTNWQITLFQLAAIIVLSVVTWGFTHRLASRISREVLEIKQRVEADASQSLTAFRQLKASALEDDAMKKFAEPVDDMAKLMTRQHTYNAVPKPAGEMLILLLVIGTVYFMYTFTNVEIASQIPTLMLLLIIANRLFMSLARLASSYMAFTASLPSLNLVANALGQQQSRQISNYDCDPVDLTKDIVFSDVSFQYADNSSKIVDGLDLKIAGGELTALVGRSGGGKSTVIDLLLGFIQPQSGTLFLDGRNSRGLNFKKVRERIGYVSQDVFLFDCSIRENFLVHDPNADEVDMLNVCRQAHIDELISKLPDGLDSLVGARGERLSGGERQRLAIAISLLRDPDLLIFDEATNALDPDAESAVHQAIRGLQNKTVLFVTHNVSSALDPDHMFLLQHGKASELIDSDVADTGTLGNVSG